MSFLATSVENTERQSKVHIQMSSGLNKHIEHHTPICIYGGELMSVSFILISCVPFANLFDDNLN